MAEEFQGPDRTRYAVTAPYVPGEGEDTSRANARVQFQNFIRNFTGGDERFIYKDMLIENYNRGIYLLDIALNDLKLYSEVLADGLQTDPVNYLPLFEQAAMDVITRLRATDEVDTDGRPPRRVQIALHSTSHPMQLRTLTSKSVSKLVNVAGIIISASRSKVKATSLQLMCRTCRAIRGINVPFGVSKVTLPNECNRPRTEGDDPCPRDPYTILADRCDYVDTMTIRLQELPEDVPTGDMPRTIMCAVDRNLTGRIYPGARVAVLGTFAVFDSAAAGSSRNQVGAQAVRHPYIYSVGVSSLQAVLSATPGEAGMSTLLGGSSSMFRFTEEEANDFATMAASTDIYSDVAKSIAPAIFGHEDIKKAVACMLFGGSRKVLADGMRLRGDINVLLMGDPSTAKSQLLKFTEKIAPIGVYTSGKGSSAAGLTAAITRDGASGEFYLEGGAMVLADGGVVCIDEFDKMREQDRVAIHEAMEQQTISIAKAGITTILNARTSVLAAANPTFGRYDDMRGASEQMDFQSTILSRFDLIFIVRDSRDDERDRTLINHVIDTHKKTERTGDGKVAAFDIDLLRRYIAYCRIKAAPRLSEEAATLLENQYVSIRDDVRRKFYGRSRGGETAENKVLITVRQLEAIIRVAESLAKMQLSDEAKTEHIEEAIRLFRLSTLEAAKSGAVEIEGLADPATIEKIEQIQLQIRRRLPIGHTVRRQTIKTGFQNEGMSDLLVERAIGGMVRSGELTLRRSGNFVERTAR